MIVAASLTTALGLVVGSFLNVVIHRIPRGESILRPGLRKVPQSPLVPLLTATLFGLITLRFGLSAALPAYLYLAAIAVALAMIDLTDLRLPNQIVLPSYLVAGALLVPAAVAAGTLAPVVRAVTAMAALWLFYYGIRAANPRGMGFGDVKLAGLLGIYLGWLGWSSVVVGAFAGFLLGGLAGAALMMLRRAGPQERDPVRSRHARGRSARPLRRCAGHALVRLTHRSHGLTTNS